MEPSQGRRGPDPLVEQAREVAGAVAPHEALRFLRMPREARRRRPQPGAAPGEMMVPAAGPRPEIRVMAYDAERVEERRVDSPEALRELIARPGETCWIDVQGLGDREVLTWLGAVLEIHPLALADVVHVPQRPKAELYGDRLLLVAQMVRLTEAGDLDVEQLSLVLGPSWVVSFQERPGDVFDPLRERVRAGARVREMGPDYLAYTLLDAVIDGYFPVIDALAGVVDALEEDVVEQASRATLARIHTTRRLLLTLHRIQRRQRDAIATLLRDETLPITAAVKPYLRDAHDHAFQTLDALETYREMCVGLMDLHLSTTSNRINEVMKTLTIVATIFIPLTFITGVYGMNFKHMPELAWFWSYPATWLVMVGVAVGLLIWFRSRGWLGGEEPDE